MNKETLSRLLRVAKGQEPPDTIIRNGRIINVFTNTIEDGRSILIKDGWIVSVEPEGAVSTPKGAKEIDAAGRYLCPGFIDVHTHLDSMYTFSEFVPYSLRGGTTTVITESTMAANACGVKGVLSLVESTKGYPLRCYFVAPPLTPPFPKLEQSTGLTLREFGTLLKREDFVGIGEAYWTRLVDGDDRVLKQAALAISLNKRLDGHSSGAHGLRLTQYALTGITSCHESVIIDEVIEKLRLGIYVLIREGWVRRELAELSKVKDLTVDMRRVILTSDVFDPVMLIEEGYLDSIVRRAIEYGFQPLDAIKMVTINCADYHGFRFLGAIAPLRYADILFLSDLERVEVESVMQNGEIVVSDGSFTGTLTPSRFPEDMKRTLTLEDVGEADFRIRARPSGNTVRVLELVSDTITKPFLWEAPVKDGYLTCDPGQDIVYAAVINRHDKSRIGKGFAKATGIKNGAVATTVIWDACNILVLGTTERDMTEAVNRLIAIQGGITVSREGKVIYEFPMPVFGEIPILAMPELRDKVKALDVAMAAIGTTIARPFLTIQTIPFTGLPFFRITDKGLADMKAKKLVPLFVNG